MITYELILEYLAEPTNPFSSQPNIMTNKFNHFSDIFDDTFYRYGVDANNSLLQSLIFCLDEPSLIIDNNLSTFANTICINIIIFDFKNNKIFAVNYGEFFNPWRPTILLAKFDTWWEPIISFDTKIFTYSSNKSTIFKNKILVNEILHLDNNIPITINDNFNEIIEMDKLLPTKNDTFINQTSFTKNKLDKMKKDELLQILSNMNVDIPIKKPTKKDLISLIIV